ncbi:hypothetical protein PPL_05214 [Heterostelium album PN500]|uniref:MYND-type domain-containing protein n=1 Tax=Heterostelium pallidum (strain ATCC 26659 / Pp 5 / PN500) TaxID=670386 RepID=D3B9R8_HETP5|nr:hypothetical protein PPL_05214 [Heterostelium album PN500]EFA81980.1 hypothetical protein PPL_05214 [Heterostelium album PN500]|eukprot:XP_020434097.1 hypothetical protein PPL_05214 [Heterostelium album PN500]
MGGRRKTTKKGSKKSPKKRTPSKKIEDHESDTSDNNEDVTDSEEDVKMDRDEEEEEEEENIEEEEEEEEEETTTTTTTNNNNKSTDNIKGVIFSGLSLAIDCMTSFIGQNFYLLSGKEWVDSPEQVETEILRSVKVDYIPEKYLSSFQSGDRSTWEIPLVHMVLMVITHLLQQKYQAMPLFSQQMKLSKLAVQLYTDYVLGSVSTTDTDKVDGEIEELLALLASFGVATQATDAIRNNKCSQSAISTEKEAVEMRKLIKELIEEEKYTEAAKTAGEGIALYGLSVDSLAKFYFYRAYSKELQRAADKSTSQTEREDILLDLSRMRSIKPGWKYCSLLLSIVQSNDGKHQDAKKSINACLKLDPTSKLAKKNKKIITTQFKLNKENNKDKSTTKTRRSRKSTASATTENEVDAEQQLQLAIANGEQQLRQQPREPQFRFKHLPGVAIENAGDLNNLKNILSSKERQLYVTTFRRESGAHLESGVYPPGVSDADQFDISKLFTDMYNRQATRVVLVERPIKYTDTGNIHAIVIDFYGGFIELIMNGGGLDSQDAVDELFSVGMRLTVINGKTIDTTNGKRILQNDTMNRLLRHEPIKFSYCSYCFKHTSKMLRCSQCKSSYYCSKECQNADNKLLQHSLICKQPKSLTLTGPSPKTKSKK